MPDRKPFTCFCAMKYASPLANSIHSQAEAIFKKFGFKLTKGANTTEPWITTSEKIKKEIDSAFAVIVETAEISWWIAFEVFCSVPLKVILPLIPADLPDTPAQAFVQMFPNDGGILYTTYGADHFDERLPNAISNLLAGAATWAKSIGKASLATAPPRPSRVVDALLEKADTLTDPLPEGASADPFTLESVFQRWTASDRPIRAAIIGPPGAGKTLVLAEFARRALSSHEEPPKTTADLTPLIVFLRAIELPEPVDLFGFVRDRIKTWQSSTKQRGLFEPFRAAWLVYILVDGIDEFVVRRRDEAEKFKEQLMALQGEGIHLIVSCRENLWLQQMQSRHSYQTIRILSFDQEQARSLLRGVTIPQCALEHERVKDWLLNPMFLRFILDLSKAGAPTDFGDSRMQLYESWARMTLAGNIPERPSIESILKFYGAVALALLQGRAPSLSVQDVARLMDQCFGNDRPKMEQILNSDVLVERKNQRIEFAHESIYEFVVARSLKGDFLKATAPSAAAAQFSELGLSRVELDYPQSAVYGFLQEFLNKESGEQFENRVRRSLKRLIAATKKLAPESQRWGLIRNLIEYLGMVQCTGDTDEITALDLISIAKDVKVNARVRYNALRALERVHPCAPRPYFRHVSDWGDLDYGELQRTAERAENEEQVPCVMRGHGKGKSEPGKHWAWVPNKGINPRPTLQKRISNELGLLLGDVLAPALHEGLSINASHAWLRWYDRSDARLLKQLRTKTLAAGHACVRHNLSLIGVH